MDSREEYVKSALADFLNHQSADTSISSIDEIVLSYMVSILEELGSDGGADDAFDIESFTEMMEAYLPGFAEIDSVQVTEWMFDLASKLDNWGKYTEPEPQSLLLSLPKEISSPVDIRPPSLRSRSSSTSTPTSCSWNESHKLGMSPAQSEGLESNGTAESEEEDEMVKTLREMFPAACSLEISHCLCVASGKLETAANLIMHRQEMGESIKDDRQRNKKPHKSTNILGDNEMKRHIVARYSYISTDDDKKDHKPLAVKKEPKKMVRYLENQVVTTKGEKFTEIKKKEGDDMKQTYVNLKPAKQYRFH